ncbi:MAG: hypothetical protein JWO53_1130, partial [Chlamydiia bacterium]|nr:hypothetical protein [Chlamydiia bacterium]
MSIRCGLQVGGFMVPVQHIPANGTNFAQINLEVTPSVLQNSAHKVDVQSKNIFYFFPQKVKKLTREVQEFIASFVIHAQSFKKGACISWRETILKQCREKHLPATITNLEIDSSTSLNGVSIQTDHNQPFENQRWIVYFLPN